MRLEVRDFEADDLSLIIPREHDVRLAGSLPDMLDRVIQYAEMGPALTVLCDGAPLLCGGVVKLWPGVGEGWLYVSATVREHRLSFHRVVSQLLLVLVEREGLHRLQVSIPEWNGMSCRWIRRLGFKDEGRMRGYGPDRSDFLRFALLTGEEGAPCLRQ